MQGRDWQFRYLGSGRGPLVSGPFNVGLLFNIVALSLVGCLWATQEEDWARKHCYGNQASADTAAAVFPQISLLVCSREMNYFCIVHVIPSRPGL